MKPKISCEVLVVGAGPAGSATATMLARRGIPVCLLGRSSRQVPARIDTLPPEATRLLLALSSSDILSSCGAVECPGIVSVWSEGQPIEKDFLVYPFGPGHHINRQRFDKSLLAATKQCENVTYYDGMLTDCMRENGGFSVRARLANQRSYCIKCRFIVDASGQNAVAARQLGITREIYERSFAARTITKVSQPISDYRLWLERTSWGWFYSVPYDSGHYQLSFVGRNITASPNWRQSLSQEIEKTRFRPVAESPNSTSWLCCRANTSMLEIVAEDGFYSVGDAAGSISPLAGHGLLIALDSGMVVANAVFDALRGEDLAADRYARDLSVRFAAMRTALGDFMGNSDGLPRAIDNMQTTQT